MEDTVVRLLLLVLGENPQDIALRLWYTGYKEGVSYSRPERAYPRQQLMSKRRDQERVRDELVRNDDAPQYDCYSRTGLFLALTGGHVIRRHLALWCVVSELTFRNVGRRCGLSASFKSWKRRYEPREGATSEHRRDSLKRDLRKEATSAGHHGECGGNARGVLDHN